MKNSEFKPDYREFVYFKQLDFSIAPNMVPGSNGFFLSLNWFGRKRMLKCLESDHYRLASLKELNKAFDYSWKSKFNEVAVSMVSTIEAADDIICFPIDNVGRYPRCFEPRLQTGDYPMLIQKADEEKRGSKDIVKGGERIEIPEFPTKSARLREKIEVLGLARGTKIIYSDRYDEEQKGVKNLIRGNMSINPKNRYVLATFSPWRRIERMGFRFSSSEPTDNVVIREFTLDDYFKKS